MSALLLYLLDISARLYICLLLLRFLFQAFRVDFYNPFAQAVVKATNPVLKPLRRIIPGWGGYDVAAIVASLLLFGLLWQLIALFSGQLAELPDGLTLVVGVSLWAFKQLLLTFLDIFFYALIAQVILSWVNPMALSGPVGGILNQLLSPIMRPIQRWIPPFGGLDLSPVVVLIVLQALTQWLHH